VPSLHVIAYLTLLYTGPHVDTFHRSRRVTTTSVTVTGDTVKQRWLVPTRGNNGFVAGRPVKQPSCHIYLRRLNLSRRSAPFIPSGSTDCITAGATGAWPTLSCRSVCSSILATCCWSVNVLEVRRSLTY